MDGIQQMFAELDGYNEYEAQLTIWCQTANVRKRETDRQWLAFNAKRKRETDCQWQSLNRDRLRESNLRWRATLPADECWCRAKKAPGRALCVTHLAHMARYRREKRREQRAA